MNMKDKELARKLIAEYGWNEQGIIYDDPGPLYRDKEVMIMYENMDGRLCRCNAIFRYAIANTNYFEATNGPAKGNRMGRVIAWKPMED